MEAAIKIARPALEPLALKDAPSLIERVFPALKISAEAQKERKAGAGQTLTALGSYWKGRKPLIMVRAIVLGCLLPVTENLEADLTIFEKLMAIDDASFGRREPNLKVAEIAERIILNNPWDYFDYTIKGGQCDPSDVAILRFPLKLSHYSGLTLRWKRSLTDTEKHALLTQALEGLSYEEKVALCKRPEECNSEVLYGPIWNEVNAHLSQWGVYAHSHEELVEQLGILRYGHRPRVGDTFCGGGSIPFEAARLGCDVYASDLNPVACMLTWGAFNIIGASSKKRDDIEKAQKEVAEAVDREITELGIEHNDKGDRAKAFLYCLETRCPETGWMVPMAPSWVISKQRNVVAKLRANHKKKCFDIEIFSGVNEAEMKLAAQGTIQDGSLVYELEGKVYRTSIRTLRGDYRCEQGETRNRLRQWGQNDFKPHLDDVFQERLYCIQWITKATLGKSRQETYFASVTEADLERERKVEHIVEENILIWQEKGLVPNMVIEPGAETTRLYRERGWRYWHHLFNARSLLLHQIVQSKTRTNPFLIGASVKILDFCCKICGWATGVTRESPSNAFANQALNTNYNWSFYAMTGCLNIFKQMNAGAFPINKTELHIGHLEKFA